MRIVIDASCIMRGCPIRIANVADRKQKGRDWNRNRNNHQGRRGEIDDVSEKHRRNRTRCAKGRIGRVISLFVPGARVADDQPEEIQYEESRGTDESLHWKREKVEREHIEQQMPNVRIVYGPGEVW